MPSGRSKGTSTRPSLEPCRQEKLQEEALGARWSLKAVAREAGVPRGGAAVAGGGLQEVAGSYRAAALEADAGAGGDCGGLCSWTQRASCETCPGLAGE